jgi:two-component system sensor histidine kinase RegB
VESSDESHLWLSWLTRLRWVALVAQFITLGFAFPLLDSVSLLVPLAALMGMLLLANLRALQVLRREGPIRQETLLWQLAVDVLALTTFFLLGGGPDNPFVVLYLIHIALGSIMLRPVLAGILALLVLVCYGAIHLWHLPLHFENHTIPPALLRPLGSVLAFLVTTLSIAGFTVGLSDTLRRRKEQLLEARDRTSRIDRLRSVGTLAAGAAHELNTPLSTLGLRLRRIGRRYNDPDTTRDLQVMKTQLERCTRIVQQLLAGAGDPSAVGMEAAPIARLVSECIRLWEKSSTLDVQLVDQSQDAEVELPRVAFSQALTNLLENARQAQEEVACFDPLVVRLTHEGSDVVVEVRDHGVGLPSEDPDQVGTPFFTTKPTGTGLGVFVARQVADGAGGGLRYVNHTDGTTARWWFPITTPKSRPVSPSASEDGVQVTHHERRTHGEGQPAEAAGGG